MDFLIVDDDQRICEGMAHRLQEMSDSVDIGRVYVRHSGEEAVAFLAETMVDVLITDIRMYEMDGLTLVARAKTLCEDMGVVIITAYHDLAYAQQAIRVGVDDFLLKPCSMQAMRETISRVTDRLRIQRDRARKQLDMALMAGMARPGITAQPLFAEHGIACPDGPLYLVVWAQDPAVPDLSVAPSPGVWRYWMHGEGRLLAWHGEGEEAAFRGWLEACAGTLDASLGVSAPGETLAQMAAQAEEALGAAWLWTSPRAIFFRPAQGVAGEAWRTLVRHVRTLHLKAARGELSRLQALGALDDPLHACALYDALHDALLQICAEYDLDMPDAAARPAPYLGGERAFDRLLTAIEVAVSGMADEADLYPIAWAKRYARERFGETIDMAEVARRLKMSYTYFSRLFKEQTGTTFSEYLLDLRIREAKRLLLHGMNVAEVAEHVGYTNVYNFTRAFTKKCGIAPAKWRKEIALGGATAHEEAP